MTSLFFTRTRLLIAILCFAITCGYSAQAQEDVSATDTLAFPPASVDSLPAPEEQVTLMESNAFIEMLPAALVPNEPVVTPDTTPVVPEESLTTTTSSTVPLPPKRLPPNLMDVRLEIANPYIESFKAIQTHILMWNFGSDPSVVSLRFEVLDTNSAPLFVGKATTTVQTESIYRPKFSDLNLPPGNYILRLHIRYGNNITDQFQQPFTIIPAKKHIAPYVFMSVVLLAALIILSTYLFSCVDCVVKIQPKPPKKK